MIEETGLAAGVLNHPATGVAWLANKIAPYDEQLNAGDVVLAGSFTRPTTAVRGDSFHVDYGPLGSIAISIRLTFHAACSWQPRTTRPTACAVGAARSRARRAGTGHGR